jgi:hypothetical protein
VESERVQGEGSWVEVKEIRYGEYKAARKMAAEGSAGDDLDDQIIRDHVAAWNWVDDADQELPLPSVQPAVIDDLTVQEKGFLITAIFQVESEKN